MTTFYVGQRVKYVRRPHQRNDDDIDHSLPMCKLGMTGTVVGTASRPNLGFVVYGDYNISLLMDGFPHPAMGIDYCYEPILPEGHQPAELSVEELLPFLKERTRA